MNETNHKSTNTHGPDEVDLLLSKFFKSQVPTNWPKAPAVHARSVKPAAVAASSIDTTSHSRWALVASVALMLGGYWFLNSQATDGKNKSPLNYEDSSANLKAIKDLSKKSK